MARNPGKKLKDFLTLFVILFGLAAVSAWLANRASVGLSGVPRIIDGDSLFLNGQEIRLQGIDAPELRQNCLSIQSSGYPCGRASANHLRKLAGAGLRCEGWEYDKYERLLAICFAGEIEINRRMVSDGWAVAFGSYGGAEREAKDRKLGLWSGSFKLPSDWRREDAHDSTGNWIFRLFN